VLGTSGLHTICLSDRVREVGHLIRRFTFRENLNSPPQIVGNAGSTPAGITNYLFFVRLSRWRRVLPARAAIQDLSDAAPMRHRKLRRKSGLTGFTKWSSALPLSLAGWPAVIDQFDSDVVSFQFGYAFTLVLGAIISDRGATIRIRNHCDCSRDLIAGTDFTGFVEIALHPGKLPEVNLCQTIHSALGDLPSYLHWFKRHWRGATMAAARLGPVAFISSAQRRKEPSPIRGEQEPCPETVGGYALCSDDGCLMVAAKSERIVSESYSPCAVAGTDVPPSRDAVARPA
jgi:hypothetical protein